MPTVTIPFDAAQYLTTLESQAELLSDAFATGDTGYIANALGVIARARGMGEVARGAGVTREALYKALSRRGDPKLTTLLGVIKSLGFTLIAQQSSSGARPRGGRARSWTKRKPGVLRRVGSKRPRLDVAQA